MQSTLLKFCSGKRGGGHSARLVEKGNGSGEGAVSNHSFTFSDL